MYHLRANNDVLEDTWWESGGNDLWGRFATPDNVDRETNTLFLTNKQWKEFESEAKLIPGWTTIYPFPATNPVWVMKQEIDIYICNDPWVWLQSIDAEIRLKVKQMYTGTKEDRQVIIDAFNAALKEVVDLENSRWELFGIKPKYSKRMYANQRCATEFTGRYDNRYWCGLRGICDKASREFTQKFYYILEMKFASFKSPDTESKEDDNDDDDDD